MVRVPSKSNIEGYLNFKKQFKNVFPKNVKPINTKTKSIRENNSKT